MWTSTELTKILDSISEFQRRCDYDIMTDQHPDCLAAAQATCAKAVLVPNCVSTSRMCVHSRTEVLNLFMLEITLIQCNLPEDRLFNCC
jgi:hypothetical protein